MNGFDLAKRMADYYGGTRLYIAKLANMTRHQRNSEIVSKYRDGTRPSAIAKEYGLSERQVFNIIRRYRHDDIARADRTPERHP